MQQVLPAAPVEAAGEPGVPGEPAMELRCDNSLHGTVEDGVFTVKCRSRFCGSRAGVVVLHRFNVHTGELVQTLMFAEPTSRRKSVGNRR